LTAAGIEIAIDDYGTGYSNLAYPASLAVHELKIDRSFVQDMTRQPTHAAIVASTVGLGHSLGLRLVAEGVEDAATWEQLRPLGCEVV
jgi:EAL domain-containing protein (putative c-di-GMP-specific phosphodiesterase class I)